MGVLGSLIAVTGLFVAAWYIDDKELGCIYITEKGSYFKHFLIPKDKLSEMLTYYATLKEMDVLSTAI